MIRWYCPRCTEAASTVPGSTQVPWHNCSGLAGLHVALLQEGVKAKVEAVEREDWIGSEDVQYDAAGRPVMATVTTRDDGQDVAVYAPCASISAKAV